MIKSAMRFKLSLDETLLEPDIYHLNPQSSDTQWFRNVIRYSKTVRGLIFQLVTIIIYSDAIPVATMYIVLFQKISIPLT